VRLKPDGEGLRASPGARGQQFMKESGHAAANLNWQRLIKPQEYGTTRKEPVTQCVNNEPPPADDAPIRCRTVKANDLPPQCHAIEGLAGFTLRQHSVKCEPAKRKEKGALSPRASGDGFLHSSIEKTWWSPEARSIRAMR